MSEIYAYIRVSTREQNEDRQLIAVKEMGVSQKKILRLSYERFLRQRLQGK